ncbi:unnamed protein product, partial [Prorocentrum cordatum]
MAAAAAAPPPCGSAPGAPPPLAAALGRGFERHYRLDAGGEAGNDVLVRRHANGLLVTSLAPSHPLLRRDAKRVAQVAFRSSVADKEAHGKRNKGGASLKPQTVLADVSLEDGSKALLFAGVDARLVEVNERLSEEPGSLQDAPEDEGFLTILQPRWPQD